MYFLSYFRWNLVFLTGFFSSIFVLNTIFLSYQLERTIICLSNGNILHIFILSLFILQIELSHDVNSFTVFLYYFEWIQIGISDVFWQHFSGIIFLSLQLNFIYSK